MPAPRPSLPALRVCLYAFLALALQLPVASARYASATTRPERLRQTQVFSADQRIGPIYYPAHAEADDPERQAAEILGRYLGKISGQPWEVLPEPASASAKGVFIGHTRRAFVDGLWRAQDPHAPLQLPTDRIEYAILPTHISLVGENPRATLSGVYRFLETYTGARWYAPGEFGEEIPTFSHLKLPQKRDHWQPSFRERQYYAASNEDFHRWAQSAGASAHFNVGHNLHKIFTPELYATHPEYWAQVGGERRSPASAKSAAQSSQLDYTNPQIARLSAEAARDAFDADPERLSFSLGINDTLAFGDDEATLNAISPLRYRHGHPVFSNLVFAFSNDVAREVGQTHPDRYLPTLAYMWAEALPDFAIEPNLMPYLCLDYAQWYDPQRRRTDMELVRNWAHSGASELGTWEYYYGNGYFVPRIFNSITADSLKCLHQQGFRSAFFEGGTNTGFDAPKMWLASRLLWDIDADPAALLHDFYHGYYGAAGATMQELFEYFERIWMEQQGEPYWLKYFLNINQASLYPPAVLQTADTLLARARAELDAAEAPARYYLRLQQTADNFAYLQAASHYYHLYRELITMPLANEQDVAHFIELEHTFAAARQALIDAPRTQMPPLREMRSQLLQLRPASRLATALWKHPELFPATEQIPLPAPLGHALPTAQSRKHQLLREDFSQPLLAGDSEGFAPQRSVITTLASGWNLRWTHSEAASLLRKRTRTGFAPSVGNPPADSDAPWTLTLAGQEFLSLFRWLELPEAATLIGTRLEVLGQVGHGTQLRLSLSWLNAEHKPVGESIYNLLTPGDYSDWQDFGIAGLPPAEARWVYIGIRLQHQEAGQILELRDWEAFSWQDALTE